MMEEVSRFLENSLGVPAPARIGEEALLEWLRGYCNDLVRRDFAGLVQLLYRVDVPEQQVRASLKASSDLDAGAILAPLILERVCRIVLSRKERRGTPAADTDEEVW